MHTWAVCSFAQRVYTVTYLLDVFHSRLTVLLFSKSPPPRQPSPIAHCSSSIASWNLTNQCLVLASVLFTRKRLSFSGIMCYKIVHGLVSIPFESCFKLSVQQNTRGHSLKLLYPDSRVGVRAQFPCTSYFSLEPPFFSYCTSSKHRLLQFKTSLKSIDLSYALLGKSEL